jgi:hypothetical protein
MANNYVSQILLKNIPDLLGVMLTGLLRRVIRLRSWLAGNPPIGLIKVYDVANAGPRNRFTVLGDHEILAHNCIQKSGHMCLMLFLYKVTMEFWRQEIKYDWLIYDYHDETDPIIAAYQIPLVKKIYSDTLNWLNTEVLASEIPLKAEPQIAISLAEIKCEGYHEDDLDEDVIELLEELNQ